MSYTDETSLVRFFVDFLYDRTKTVYDPEDPDTREAIVAAHNADVDGMNERILKALIPPPATTWVTLEIPANEKYSLEGASIEAIEIRRVRWFQPAGDRVHRYLYVGSEQFKVAPAVVAVRLGENDRRIAVEKAVAFGVDHIFIEAKDFDGAPVSAVIVIAVESLNLI